MKKYLPFILSEAVILFMCLALMFSVNSMWVNTAIIVVFGALTILNIKMTHPDKEETECRKK